MSLVWTSGVSTSRSSTSKGMLNPLQALRTRFRKTDLSFVTSGFCEAGKSERWSTIASRRMCLISEKSYDRPKHLEIPSADCFDSCTIRRLKVSSLALLSIAICLNSPCDRKEEPLSFNQTWPPGGL